MLSSCTCSHVGTRKNGQKTALDRTATRLFRFAMADTQTPTLFACALDVLTTGDAFAKAEKTAEYVAQWKSGAIKEVCNEDDDVNNVPDHPARPENVEVVPAYKAKQGSRKAFVHRRVTIFCIGVTELPSPF